MRLFLQRSNARTIPADYQGDVLVWDIDKTYLDTRFSSWRGLVSIPFEAAIDKRAVAGAVPLLRALRHGRGEQSALVPLYFVSGSPPQLRSIVERKMTLDGVEFDGITFKDQWALVRDLRPRAVKEQIGYKLTALLLYRREIANGARYFFFGDDVESDAEVFALFGEVCAGLRGMALAQRLRAAHVDPVDVENICQLSHDLAVTDNPVERIFIYLEKGRAPSSFTEPRVVPAHSFLQTALVLAHMGRIRPQIIATVAADVRKAGAGDTQIEEWINDAKERFDVPDTLTAWVWSDEAR